MLPARIWQWVAIPLPGSSHPEIKPSLLHWQADFYHCTTRCTGKKRSTTKCWGPSPCLLMGGGRKAASSPDSFNPTSCSQSPGQVSLAVKECEEAEKLLPSTVGKDTAGVGVLVADPRFSESPSSHSELLGLFHRFLPWRERRKYLPFWIKLPINLV